MAVGSCWRSRSVHKLFFYLFPSFSAFHLFLGYYNGNFWSTSCCLCGGLWENWKNQRQNEKTDVCFQTVEAARASCERLGVKVVENFATGLVVVAAVVYFVVSVVAVVAA